MAASIDLTEAFAVLNRLAALNMQPWLAAVGAQQVEVIRERITDDKGSPDNERWDPWSPRRLYERLAKGNAEQGLLWDEGTLLHSIRFQVSPHQVEIGTDVPYAKELQEGRSSPTRMPARPFVGWGEEGIGFALNLSGAATIEGSAIAFIDRLMRP